MIKIIACIDSASGIGRVDGSLLFHIKEDMQRFKDITKRNTCLMGRKTFDSIISMNGAPLPNRTTAILTHNNSYESKYGELAYTDVSRIINHSKTLTEKDKTIYVCGGSEVYKEMLPFTDEILLTIVNKHIEGEDIVHYPMQQQIDLGFVPVEESEEYYTEKYDAYYKFVRYVKQARHESGGE